MISQGAAIIRTGGAACAFLRYCEGASRAVQEFAMGRTVLSALFAAVVCIFPVAAQEAKPEGPASNSFDELVSAVAKHLLVD